MKELFQKWKNKINDNLIQSVGIEHVGGSSIQGAKTKGDLDICVQVSQGEFEEVCDKMRILTKEHCKDLWRNDFAIFQTYGDEIKIDIMVVVKDSPYDSFVKVRDVLFSDPLLLGEYNKIKNDFVARTEEYQKAKNDFFQKIIKEKLDILS